MLIKRPPWSPLISRAVGGRRTRGSFLFLPQKARERKNNSMESPRELAEAVDAALAGLSCNVVELRAALNRAKHGMLDLLRVPVS